MRIPEIDVEPEDASISLLANEDAAPGVDALWEELGTIESKPTRRQPVLDEHVMSGGARASNPAEIKVDFSVYKKAYPTWYWTWRLPFYFCLITTFINLLLLSWWCVLSALMSIATGYIVWIYMRRVKSQFWSGDTTPGRVVSLNPPLAAYYTNLLKADWADCPVIQIQYEPLNMLTTGPVELGQKLAGIAFYVGLDEELDHWSGFSPRISACATRDEAVIRRNLNSISERDWQQLDEAIGQFSDYFEPGTFRIYQAEQYAERGEVSPQMVREVVLQTFRDLRRELRWLRGEPLKKELVHSAKAAFGDFNSNKLIAMIPKAHMEEEMTKGVILLSDGVRYRLGDEEGFFRWNELVGAFTGESVFEITLTDGSRIRVDRASLYKPTVAYLEIALNSIAKL